MNVKINRLSKEELDAPREAPAIPEIASLGALIFRDDADAVDGDDGDLENEGASEEVFHALILERDGGIKTRFFIKELDFFTNIDVEAGRLLVQGREIVRAPGRESKMGLALEVCATVYKRVNADKYEPYFADTDAAQKWMKQRRNKPLISRILTGIYIANPELSPQKKMQAAKSLT